MKSRIITLLVSLSLFMTSFASSSHLKACETAWKNNSASQSCVKSQTVITSSGTHCNIEAICLNRCTDKTLTDINYVSIEQMKNLQNCDGQLQYSSKQCAFSNEDGCVTD